MYIIQAMLKAAQCEFGLVNLFIIYSKIDTATEVAINIFTTFRLLFTLIILGYNI